MPTNFTLTLDTTGPQDPLLVLADGAAFTSNPIVPVMLTTSDPVTDGYQVKLWGDVDVTSDVNFQATEAESNWLGYGTVPEIRLDTTTDNGPRTIHARIRDDVGNESIVTDYTIQLDLTLPVVTITVDPSRTKISKIAPWHETVFTFESDSDLCEWMVAVVPDANAIIDQAIEIPQDGGSTTHVVGEDLDAVVLAAATPQLAIIRGVDLQTAVGPDGDYVIKVFGCETGSGFWSV